MLTLSRNFHFSIASSSLCLQERLKSWEHREKNKARDAAKEKEKRRIKEEERQKEAKRLKEFLEDYEDERDDVKYYKYVYE